MKINCCMYFTARARRKFLRGRVQEMCRTSPKRVLTEITEYITAHEALGIAFDTAYQVFVYDGNLAFAAKKCEGYWVITNVLILGEPRAYIPVFISKRFKCGAVRFLQGWRVLRMLDSWKESSRIYSGCVGEAS